MVYEEEPYLHTYPPCWLQAIQLFRPARGVTTVTPGYRQGKRASVKKLSIGNPDHERTGSSEVVR